MLKKTILLANFLFLSIVMIAQTEAQLEKMSKYTCECIGTTEKISKLNKTQLQMQLGVCMLKAAKDANYKISMSDSDDMRVLGEKLGMKMAFDCPTVLMSLIDEQDLEDKVQTQEGREPSMSALPEPPPQIYPTVTGKVTNIVETDFITLTIVDDAKKEHKLVWFESFDGDAAFLQDANKLKKGKFKFTYRTAERYVPKNKDNSVIRVITKVDKM